VISLVPNGTHILSFVCTSFLALQQCTPADAVAVRGSITPVQQFHFRCSPSYNLPKCLAPKVEGQVMSLANVETYLGKGSCQVSPSQNPFPTARYCSIVI